MKCKDRSGFLFAHSCDRPATEQCSRCGRYVCRDHIRRDGAAFCVTCVKAQGKTEEWDDDDPYFYARSHYAGYHYYDSHDRRVFDSTESEIAEYEGDFDGS